MYNTYTLYIGKRHEYIFIPVCHWRILLRETSASIYVYCGKYYCILRVAHQGLLSYVLAFFSIFCYYKNVQCTCVWVTDGSTSLFSFSYILCLFSLIPREKKRRGRSRITIITDDNDGDNDAPSKKPSWRTSVTDVWIILYTYTYMGGLLFVYRTVLIPCGI